MTTENKKRQRAIWAVNITIAVLSCLMMTFLVAYTIVGDVFFSFALDATFASLSNAPSDMVFNMPTPRTEDEWLENIDKTEVSILSDDNYKLSGYLIENDASDVYVISIHGYRGKNLEMSFYARKFYERGFSVLLPDLEGHGKSEGQYVGMGYFDRLDILKWIDFILEKKPSAKIVLHGVSMGAATVMCTAGEPLKENVVCMIEDCGYTCAYDQFMFVLCDILKLPFKEVIMSASDLIAKVRLGESLKKLSCIDQLKKATKPMLFIHGSSDDFVPFSMLDELYNANNNIYKEKLVVEGATHAYSATKDPELYFKTVFDFIDRFI